MKCPKCDYLGFETGDRCKNCGYDFSLLTAPAPASPVLTEPDLELNDLNTRPPATARAEVWLDRFDETLAPIDAPTAAPIAGADEYVDVTLNAPARSEHPPLNVPLVEDRPLEVPRLELAALPSSRSDVARSEPIAAPRQPAAPARHLARPALPLFTPDAEADDAPLISAARAPRPPLSVRRTPDRPRLRAVPRPVSVPMAEPALAFADPDVLTADAQAPARPGSRVFDHPRSAAVSGSPGRRMAAAAIDHGILLLVDIVVIYLTLRMAMLAPEDWAMLPRVPLLAFLCLIKLAYFYAFTAIGGQTIGKMSARLRVVTDADLVPEPAQAATRTLAGVISFLTLGLGFLPALVGDRRALHDRIARTRVVSA